jgi:sulfotransferase 6B1
VLVNSIPKAGTHLLTAVLRALPRMMFSGVQVTLGEFLSEVSGGESQGLDRARLGQMLDSVRNGQFVVAHFPAHPEVGPLLNEAGFKSLLIIRDPRDIVVSHAFYVTSQPRHLLHRRYTEQLGTDEERLLASITGLPGNGGPSLEDIGTRLDKFIPWLDDASTHLCRYESLVGPSGGGTASRQKEEIIAIAGHVDRPLSSRAAERVTARAWSRRSATFRRGQIGDWRNHFSEEHRTVFKQIAGGQLIELGYEDDTAW